MNTDPFPKKQETDNKSEAIEKSIDIYEHEINITEGSEFLDDAIRTKDQPFENATVNGNE